MTAFDARFLELAAHAEVAPLAHDGRAAVVFDRAGTVVLWANAAGLASLGLRGRFTGKVPSPVVATTRAIAAIASRLPADGARIERVPLPVAIVPVLATCSARRLTLGLERVVLVVVVDGTGALASAAAAEEGYRAILAHAAPKRDSDPASIEGAAVETVEPTETPPPTDFAEAELLPASAASAGAEEPPTVAEPRTDAQLVSEDTALHDVALDQSSFVETAAELSEEHMPAPTGVAPGVGDGPAGTPSFADTDAETQALPRPAYPLHDRTVRFVFELDPDGAFSFVSPEFAEAVGPETAALAGRTWRAVASELAIDPIGRIAAALDRRDTFTGLTVDWPVDGGGMRVPVDLAGMPVFGRDRSFRGYRGFGVAKCGAAFEVQPTAPFPLTPQEIAAGTIIVEAETEDAGDPLDAAEVGVHVPFVGGPVADSEAKRESDDETERDRAAAVAETTDDEADLANLMLLDGVEDAEAPAAIEADAEQRADSAPLPLVAADEGPGGAEFTTSVEFGDGPDDREDDREIGDGEGDYVPESDDDGAAASETTSSSDTELAEMAPEEGADPSEEDVEGFVPEGADDLGEDWAADMTMPAEAEVAERLLGDQEVELLQPPPDVDPAAPDAAPDAGADDAETDTPRASDPAPTPPADIALNELPRRPGEVIRSPIVPRPIPEVHLSPEEEARRRLSRPEREAFQKIAEALGAIIDEPTGAQPPHVAVPVDEAPRRQRATLPIDVAILDRLPIAVAVLKDGEAVIVNRAFLELAGYPDHAALEEAGGFAEAFAGSALPRDASLPAIRRRDGVEVPVNARLHSIPWQGGIASLLIVQETASATGRDRADAAEARVDELEAILDTATDGVLVLDGRGTVLGANRSAEALFGSDRSHMVGESVLSLLAPESHRAALDYLDGLARNGVASVLNDGREVIGRVPQGGLVPLFMTVGRISPAKFCAVLRDITQWKRAEEDLVSAKRSAETASSQKSDFLAKISHEIRTPLNAIIGFSEVMMEERFGPVGSERYKEYLRDIHLSGAHIMSLVNDLLDLSKIEAGKLDLSFEAVAVNDVIRESVALMQPQANRDRVIIRTSLSSSLPNVVADNRSLRQIVLNLVSNAIKFNSAGGQVIVSTIYEESGEVAIRVRDTGPGMSEDDIGKAMEPFRQLHTTRPGRGTGLGLPLTKALVEANRAAFRIESAVGQGTMVQVTFPSTRVLAE